MFIRLANHWCKPGQIEAGQKFIDRQGEIMKTAPGFKFRYRMDDVAGRSNMTTLTAWADQAAFDQFRAGRPASNSTDPTYPFERVEYQDYIVRAELGQRG